jgi:hypothetical protein
MVGQGLRSARAILHGAGLHSRPVVERAADRLPGLIGLGLSKIYI